MAFQSVRPGALLSPVPAVMVSCASQAARPNIITIAWAGTICSQPPMVSIAVRKDRFSHRILTESGEFVVNLVGEDQLRAADFCGVKSGRDMDKFAACGLTPAPVAALEHAPAIAQCPIYLACKIQQVLEHINHNLTEDLSIDTLADIAFISKFYLMRKFKAETGYSIHQYITSKRLIMAKELLSSTTLPITDICFQCGFRDYSSFFREFQKNFRISPRKFRQ